MQAKKRFLLLKADKSSSDIHPRHSIDDPKQKHDEVWIQKRRRQHLLAGIWLKWKRRQHIQIGNPSLLFIRLNQRGLGRVQNQKGDRPIFLSSFSYGCVGPSYVEII